MDKRKIHWWFGWSSVIEKMDKYTEYPIRALYADYEDSDENMFDKKMNGSDYEDVTFLTYDVYIEYVTYEEFIYMAEYHLTSYVDAIGLKEAEFISSLFQSKDKKSIELGFKIIENL